MPLDNGFGINNTLKNTLRVAVVDGNLFIVVGTDKLVVSPADKLVWNAFIASDSVPVTITDATHTVAATTKFLIANRAGTVTLTLPDPALFPGRELNVVTIQAQAVDSAGSNVVPLIGGSAGTTVLTNTDGKWARLVSDGTSWVIMAAN